MSYGKLALVSTVGLLLAGCDIEQTQEGELPDVDIQAGQLPQYDVEGPDIDIGTQQAEVEVPDIDVDVGTETETITLPDIDVDLPDDDDNEQVADNRE